MKRRTVMKGFKQWLVAVAVLVGGTTALIGVYNQVLDRREATAADYWALVNAWPQISPAIRAEIAIEQAKDHGELTRAAYGRVMGKVINQTGMVEMAPIGEELDLNVERAQLTTVVNVGHLILPDHSAPRADGRH
jgi:hypothetical protein